MIFSPPAPRCSNSPPRCPGTRADFGAPILAEWQARKLAEWQARIAAYPVDEPVRHAAQPPALRTAPVSALFSSRRGAPARAASAVRGVVPGEVAFAPVPPEALAAGAHSAGHAGWWSQLSRADLYADARFDPSR